MKATQLIAALEALVKEHGDLPVVAFDTEYRPAKLPATLRWGSTSKSRPTGTTRCRN
jgi:hypothetical protein